MPVMGAVMVRDFEITLISIDFNTVKLISEHTAASIITSEIKLTMEGQGEVTPIDSVQTPATGVKNWVKQSKWKVKRSKAHRKLEKVKGQAQLKVNRIQNLIKARYHTL